MEAKELAPWISITLAVLVLFYNIFIQSRAQNDRFAKVESKVETLVHDYDDLKKFIDELRSAMPKIDLFWQFVREQFPKMLLHPDEPERDVLLIKLTKNTLNSDEEVELEAILENEFEHMHDKKTGEALVNRLTLMSLKQVMRG